MVEGDACAVARRAAERLGGDGGRPRPLRHGHGALERRRPSTSRDRAHGDLRRGRARCPTCGPARRIEEDLARRDFTVNAIALRLADGALTEWPGAREDLARGRAAGAARALVRGRPDAAAAPGPLRRAARVRARSGTRTRSPPAADGATTVIGRPAGLRAAAAAARAPARGAAGARAPRPRPRGAAARRFARRRRRWSTARARRCARRTPAPTSPRSPPRLRRARGPLPRGARPARVRRRPTRPWSSSGRAARRRLGPALDATARRRRRCGALLRREPPEAVAVAGALGPGPPEAARRWLADVRHRRLGDHRRRLRRRRPAGPRGRRRARGGAARRCSTGEAPGAAAQLAAGLAAVRALVGSVRRWTARRSSRRSAGRASTSPPSSPAPACCSPRATAASRPRPSTRSTSAG